MSYIVIDKSYLQKVVNNASLDILAATNKIVITDILMYEITSSKDKASSKSCLKKLYDIKKSVVFMTHSGSLIEYEIVNKKPCYPFSEFLTPRYHYSAFWERIYGLMNDDPLYRDVAEHLNKQYFDFYENNNVGRIREIGNDFSKIFPELKGYKPGSKTMDTTSLKKDIAVNSDRTKRLMKASAFLIKKDGNSYSFKASEYMDEKWIYFRTLQTHLIYYVSYVEKYGDEAGNLYSKKLSHDSVDLEYCTCGVHAGKIATSDKMIRDIFSYFYPSENCFYK